MVCKFTAEMIDKIDEVKSRVIEESAKIEHHPDDGLAEEKAELRNFVMRLEGLKLLLRR